MLFSLFYLLMFLVSFIIINLCGFYYLGILIVLENLNVFVILLIFYFSLKEIHIKFLIFIVVATMEVTLGLVVLTRLWKSDSYLKI